MKRFITVEGGVELYTYGESTLLKIKHPRTKNEIDFHSHEARELWTALRAWMEENVP